MPTGESFYGGGLGGSSRHRPRRAPPVAGPGVNPQPSAPQPTHYPSPAPQVSGSSGYPGTPTSHSAPAPTPSHVSSATHPILSSLSPAELALGAYAIAAAKTYGLTPEALIGVNHLANATAPEKATLRDIAGSAREVPPAATIRQQTLPIRASGKQLATPDTARQFTGAPPRQGTLAALAKQGAGTPGRASVDAREFAKNPAQTARTVAAQRVANQLGGSLTNQGARKKLRKAAAGGPQNVLNVAGAVAPKRTKKALGGLLFATTGNTPQGQQGKAQNVAQKKQAPKVPFKDLPVPSQITTVLRRHGLNKVGAAGVAGNALQESSNNPTVGPGGLFGFTSSPVSPADLQAFAASKGKPAYAPRTQTQFVLQNTSPTLKAQLNRAGSPENAASIFMSQWERPYVPTENEPRRQQGARAAFQMEKGLKGAQALASPQKALTGKSLTHFQAIRREAARIDKFHLPYQLGGGHQGTPAPGPRATNYDCSGVVSRVLQQGGYNVSTRVSGDYMNWGKPGPGAVTIYANPEHVFMRIGNRFFGTSQANPGGGAGWVPASTYSQAYLSTFVVRHPTGLGKEAGITVPAGGPGLTDLGGGTSVGMTSGVHLAQPGSSTSPILPQHVGGGAQRRAQAGFTLPFSPTQATNPLPYGFGGDLTGAAPSGSRGSFRPRRRLSTSR